MSSEPQRTITVLYFAAASSATKLSSEVIPLPDTYTVSDQSTFPLSKLGALLISRYPNTNLDDVLKTSQWSVDAEMVDDPDKITLKGGEEVAIICPVSGG